MQNNYLILLKEIKKLYIKKFRKNVLFLMVFLNYLIPKLHQKCNYIKVSLFLIKSWR